MKKILFFLLIALIFGEIYAQDPQLFENTWYLQIIEIDGEDYFPPTNDEIDQITLNLTSIDLQTEVCNILGANIGQIDDFEFRIDKLNIIPIDCSFQENNDFDTIYFTDFYLINQTPPITFLYEIENNGDDRMLTITNSNNDIAIYDNVPLAINDFENSIITIFPNPVKDKLKLFLSQGQVSAVQLYDVMGKEIVSQTGNTQELNLESLNPGIYFLKVFTDLGAVIKKIIKH